jgi:hypothetical protein
VKITKFARGLLIPATLALALSGAALASSGDISDTGPSSTNTVTIDNNSHVDVDNHNNVTVNNNNTQSAYSGDASVSHNTTAGDANSGLAENNNSTTTTISIDNPGVGSSVDNSNPGGGGSNVGGGSLGASSVESGSSGVGGGSLGVGGGTLPETGASSPVDVSALRNLFNPSQGTPLDQVVKNNRKLSTALLAGAALMSLLGAIGSAVYSTKRTLKV